MLWIAWHNAGPGHRSEFGFCMRTQECYITILGVSWCQNANSGLNIRMLDLDSHNVCVTLLVQDKQEWVGVRMLTLDCLSDAGSGHTGVSWVYACHIHMFLPQPTYCLQLTPADYQCLLDCSAITWWRNYVLGFCVNHCANIRKCR